MAPAPGVFALSLQACLLVFARKYPISGASNSPSPCCGTLQNSPGALYSAPARPDSLEHLRNSLKLYKFLPQTLRNPDFPRAFTMAEHPKISLLSLFFHKQRKSQGDTILSNCPPISTSCAKLSFVRNSGLSVALWPKCTSISP